MQESQDSLARVRKSPSLSALSVLAWSLQGRQALCSAPWPLVEREKEAWQCSVALLVTFSVRSGETKTCVLEKRGKSEEWRRLYSRDTAIFHAIQRGAIRFQLGEMRETDGNIKPLQGRLNNEHSVFWSFTRCLHLFYYSTFQKSLGWSLYSFFSCSFDSVGREIAPDLPAGRGSEKSAAEKQHTYVSFFFFFLFLWENHMLPWQPNVSDNYVDLCLDVLT